MPGSSLPVRIIAVGDELLEGRTVDSNSRRIQRALGEHAVQTELVQVVPDRQDCIVEALARTHAGELVFLCGGLGSTPDDLTREAVAIWAGVELVENSAALDWIKAKYQARGKTPRSEVDLQALVPAGMKWVPNPVGSAPGLVGRLADRWVVLLPGFPAELSGLLPLVLVELEAQSALPPARRTLVRRLAQIPELAVVDLCRPLMDDYPDYRWSWWVTDWGVDVRVSVSDEAVCESNWQQVAARLDEALGHLVFSQQGLTLPQTIQKILLATGKTLGVAESCTAGMMGANLTAAPGASGFFLGGFIVYADEAKHKLLGVPEQVLARKGAVSEEVVRAMAEGCREQLGSTYALAVSGISGPGGGTPAKPVGTTWVALATPSSTFAHCYHFPADRQRNRLLTVAAALDSLRRVLQFGDHQDPWCLTSAWS